MGKAYRQKWIFSACALLALSLTACKNKEPAAGDFTMEQETGEKALTEEREMKFRVQIGEAAFTAELETNRAAEAFYKMLEQEPLEISMRDYAGFEKVGSLGTTLPDSSSQFTTQPGDIVLYNKDQIVMFYGSNTWDYTKLGRICELDGWEEALGDGGVTATFLAGEG